MIWRNSYMYKTALRHNIYLACSKTPACRHEGSACLVGFRSLKPDLPVDWNQIRRRHSVLRALTCSKSINTPQYESYLHKSHKYVLMKKGFYDNRSSASYARSVPSSRHGCSDAGMLIKTLPFIHITERLKSLKSPKWSSQGHPKRRTPVSEAACWNHT